MKYFYWWTQSGSFVSSDGPDDPDSHVSERSIRVDSNRGDPMNEPESTNSGRMSRVWPSNSPDWFQRRTEISDDFSPGALGPGVPGTDPGAPGPGELEAGAPWLLVWFPILWTRRWCFDRPDGVWNERLHPKYEENEVKLDSKFSFGLGETALFNLWTIAN